MHNSAPRRKRPRGGFTLVELLVVIVIIVLLASLITGAAIMTRSTARRAVDKTDVSQLAMALEKYKTEFGDYPPDFAFINHGDMSDPNEPLRWQARNELMRHIRKRWPRYNRNLTHFINSLANYGLAQRPADLSDPHMGYRIYLDPASALAFWLGGLPEDLTTPKPSGFHQDPTNPFQSGGPRTQPLFEFKPERFVFHENDPFGVTPARGMRYYPPSARVPTGGALNEYSPYVYFKARPLAAASNRHEYGYVDTSASPLALTPAYYMHGPAVGQNVAVPYLDGHHENFDDPALMSQLPPSGIRNWRNLEKFQVLCPGLDGQYGNLTAGADPRTSVDRYRYRCSRVGENLTEYDRDNMGDFSEGALEDELQ